MGGCTASKTSVITRSDMGSALTKPADTSASAQDRQTTNNSDEKDKPVEAIVCNVNDMKNGEMRVVDVGEHKALLVREHGEFHALSRTCTHYSAPLVKGVLCDGKIRCPFHGACFNIRTGDIEDFPGLDSLQKYDIEIDSGNVKVKTTTKALKTSRRVRPMACWSPDDDRVFLIIGGGAAAITAAETLRQEGFKGRVVIATKEDAPPYDRPKLSKALDSTASDLTLRDEEFYSIYDIEVRTNHEATDVDAVLKTVSFKNGQSLAYDKLLIATGGSPRLLPVTGNSLQHVYTLRTPDDGNSISKHSKGKDVVIIGSSFIGMEVAAYLSGKARSVTVIGRSQVPFQASMGPEVGGAILKMFEDKGVKFISKAEVLQFEGEAGRVKSAVLTDGTKLPAQICVIGAGVTPSTDFLAACGLEMTKSGHITVDKCMQTNTANIYAAGDIVSFPLSVYGDRMVSIGHWQLAHTQGRIAGINMTGREKQLQSVPFFWSQMFGKSLRFAGYNAGYDDVIIHGDLDQLAFAAFYTKKEEVIAIASMNYDPIVAQAAEMFSMGKVIFKHEIIDEPKSWTDRLQGSRV